MEALDLLVTRRELARALGENGWRYVAEGFRREVVMEKYRRAIAPVSR